MKSFLPWCCMLTATAVSAADGLEAYRLGKYHEAGREITGSADKGAMAHYYLGLMRLYGYGLLKNNSMALQYFTTAGEKGYLPAQRLLARYYLIEKKSPEEALEWFKKSAALEDVSAQMYVAGAYLFGFGAKKNEDLAKRYYIDAAKNGNLIAQYTLAQDFISSKDSQNKKMGVIWLTKAAQNGYPEAQARLGAMHANGILMEKDLDEANRLLEAAVRQNSLAAMVTLGEIAQKKGDLPTAKTWFLKAANQGFSAGQLALAQLLLDKSTPLNDNNAGFQWMQKAAKGGDSSAQQELAKLYKEGIGTPINLTLASQWEQAAEKEAKILPSFAIARWLSDGKSVSLDYGDYKLGGIYTAWSNPKALKENAYNEAPKISLISLEALYKPKFVMVDPKQVPINEYFDRLAPVIAGKQKAAWTFPRYEFDSQIDAVLHDDFWVIRHDKDAPLVDRDTPYQMAYTEDQPFDYFAENTKGWEHVTNLQAALNDLYAQAILGESKAQFELGQLYQYGVGVAQDIPQAIAYFELAAEQQEVRAEYNLGLIYLEGKTVPVNYKKGFEWMTDAAFKGNAYAQYVLANVYENGLTEPSGKVLVEPNHPQAMAMYYLASSNNYGEAEFQLAQHLVQEENPNLERVAKQNRIALIKRLYQGAVQEGVAEAVLPLAFYHAMDADPAKRAHAFYVANQEARLGNKDAALLLGMMYERGIAVPANLDDALYWYQQTGKSNPITAFILGTYYSTGQGLSLDLNKGLAFLQQSAKGQFSYASLNLAVLKKQKGEAFIQELDKARELGNSKAGLLLADTLTLTANGDASKLEKAREIYQYFAEKGDKNAEMKLGYLYEKGLSVAVDNALAGHWYTRAAEQGQVVAQYLLAQLYQAGRLDKEPNYALAKAWYQKSARYFPKASTALGFIYDTVDNDYASAEKAYSQAAAAKDPFAQFNLGLIYAYGKGRPVDEAKAKSYYTEASNHHFAAAMTELASLYFKEGAADKALFWYKQAGEQGESTALYQLGLLAETGVIDSVDSQAAVQYYQKATNLGNDRAAIALARMYHYGLGVNKDEAKASEIYKRLIDNNHAYAQYQLATLYMNREDLRGEAKELLQKASQSGIPRAGVVLQHLQARLEISSSFIEPIRLNHPGKTEKLSAELMYLEALNAWNRGDESASRVILDAIIQAYPEYLPAKQAVGLLGCK